MRSSENWEMGWRRGKSTGPELTVPTIIEGRGGSTKCGDRVTLCRELDWDRFHRVKGCTDECITMQ